MKELIKKKKKKKKKKKDDNSESEKEGSGSPDLVSKKVKETLSTEFFIYIFFNLKTNIDN